MTSRSQPEPGRLCPALPGAGSGCASGWEEQPRAASGRTHGAVPPRPDLPAASGRQLVPHLFDVTLAFLDLQHFQAFHWDKEARGLPWRHVEALARLLTGSSPRRKAGAGLPSGSPQPRVLAAQGQGLWPGGPVLAPGRTNRRTPPRAPAPLSRIQSQAPTPHFLSPGL